MLLLQMHQSLFRLLLFVQLAVLFHHGQMLLLMMLLLLQLLPLRHNVLQYLLSRSGRARHGSWGVGKGRLVVAGSGSLVSCRIGLG